MNDREMLLSCALLHGESAQETLFRRRFVEMILKLLHRQRRFRLDQLLILSEDFAQALPASLRTVIIQRIGLFRTEGEMLELCDAFDLASHYSGQGIRYPKKMAGTASWEEIERLLLPANPPPFSALQLAGAVKKGLGWLLDSIAWSREEGLQGLPAFWICENEKDIPLGIRYGGTCLSDTLCALSENYFGPLTLAQLERPESGPLIDSLLQFSLATRVSNEEPWDAGGFLPLEDQPGAERPTVDATADFVVAAAIFYHFHAAFAGMQQPVTTPKKTIGSAIIEALEFLLRMQLNEGGWGTYKYFFGDASVDVLAKSTPQPNPTYLSCVGFGLAKMCGVLDEMERPDLYMPINQALARTRLFLLAKKKDFHGHNIWTPFFSQSIDESTTTEILANTYWAVKALFSMARGIEAARPEVFPILQDFVKLCQDHWQPDYSELARYEFRVPLRNRFNDTFNTWEMRRDVLLSILLLDLDNTSPHLPGLDISLDRPLVEKIEITLDAVLKEQHAAHGHWHDPINKRPFAVAGLFAMEAIQGYLTLLQRSLSGARPWTSTN